jgi:hypothetical protein
MTVPQATFEMSISGYSHDSYKRNDKRRLWFYAVVKLESATTMT